jgi:hypothetical protein
VIVIIFGYFLTCSVILAIIDVHIDTLLMSALYKNVDRWLWSLTNCVHKIFLKSINRKSASMRLNRTLNLKRWFTFVEKKITWRNLKVAMKDHLMYSEKLQLANRIHIYLSGIRSLFDFVKMKNKCKHVLMCRCMYTCAAVVIRNIHSQQCIMLGAD